MKQKIVNAAEYLASYILLGIMIVLLFHFVFSLNYIPSASMENTIMTGDMVFGIRFGMDDINRYDIITFDAPDDPSITYVKRVIGLPGETVTIKNGYVYVDGEKMDDSFIFEPMNSNEDGTYVVPEKCYFMMGDNRNNSLDSRFWENKYVPADTITSKVIADLTLTHLKLFVDANPIFTVVLFIVSFAILFVATKKDQIIQRVTRAREVKK